ncbi:hypothetical protein [Pinibacter aurantiacus]|uniref:Uncharacterized protein n=1 Tax=Pinibacter aurantiacus TaxID=2851599 RepID=A0A9E2SF57_9BACT|nr:hypothetical protein [Pinibacter aurantiacus]MBV4359690.1 hypothetical protein [Pinibacter aurantiacus]
MLGLYFAIWNDLITRLKMVRPEANWKVSGTVFMTLSMSANLAVLIVSLTRYFPIVRTYELKLPFLDGYFKEVVSFLITIVLPCFLLNYFLVLKNPRFNKIQEKIRFYGGKLFAAYFAFSILFPFVLAVIYGIRNGFK